ncbi:hypothetical protein COY05_00005 [Candidatus Peregrinibacteria bacterium CG_4_10_14_0_2_um_filter_38_24]|nr:MAG: hypothetical protein COY05_00005 [Candidatus Peregrinibacteria bacterium CG_4_10_14_0_2_um_filter_38_24]
MQPPENFINEIKNLEQKFGKIFVFVDYGNVTKWFKDDIRDLEENRLLPSEKLVINIGKLAEFLDLFGREKFFYYGLDVKKIGSIVTIKKAWKYKFNVVSKNIQWIKINQAGDKIPKCNFDVEISIDIVKEKEKYDTVCLLSNDNDFSPLLEYVKNHNKKVILISGKNTRRSLKEKANYSINAQTIKSFICSVKQKKDFT